MPFISSTLDVTVANTITQVGSAAIADTKCNIYITNRTTASGNIRVAISAASPTNAEYIFYDFPIAAKGTFLITDALVKISESVWIYSPSSFSIRVEGQEIP